MSKKILSYDDIVSRALVVRVPSNDDVLIPIDEVIEDPAATNDVLERLGLSMSDVLARNDPDYSDKALEVLKGVGRIGVAPFLDLVAARQDSATPELRVKVGGKACDHIFIPDPDVTSDCPMSGSGHLSVNVLHEYFNSDQDVRACKPNKTEFYHWDIEICSYEVHKRYDLLDDPRKDDHATHFPNKPFPTLSEVAFPAPATDPDDPRSIWCRCLDHKLYAKGRNVKVERVYRQVCHHDDPSGAGDEDFHLLDPAAYPEYYQQTDDACVDIMFAGYPPLAGLPKQREYCIGRCADPDIVNTGM